MFTNPTTPNLTDFLTFLANEVQIPSAALPSDSPYPQWCLDQAVARCIPIGGNGILYVLAVYNLATAILFQITPDQVGQTYFADARKQFNLLSFMAGAVQATSDESTSTTLKVPDFVSTLTVGQLNLMQTPWGRVYLDYAQAAGPNIWGLS